MADQNLVAIHDARTNKLAVVTSKLVLWYILTTFPHKCGSFALSVDVFK